MEAILTNLLKGRGTSQMIQDTIQKYRLSHSFDQFCLNYGRPNHPIVINPWSLFHILFHSNKTKRYSLLPFIKEIPLYYHDTECELLFIILVKPFCLWIL